MTINAELLKTLVEAAGPKGLGVIAGIWIFLEIVRKNIFPKLGQENAYRLLRLIVITTWSASALWIAAGALQSGDVGDNSVVLGNHKGNVGNNSVVVGATDERGNTVLNTPMAVGRDAHAGPGSIAIGAGAGAGLAKPRQVAETSASREALARALENLADLISSAPPVVIGQRIAVTAAPGSSGTVIGKQVTVTAGLDTVGTVIGEQTTVVAGGSQGTPPISSRIASDLRYGAAKVRTGTASSVEIGSLIANSNLLGLDASRQQAIANASNALGASDLP
jgi:hypothetical protein